MSQPSAILTAASYDHTIRFWEAKSGRCYRTILYPDTRVNWLEITPDKHFLAAAGNPHIQLFDVSSNSPQSDLRAPGCQREYESRAAVSSVVLHPNQTELMSGDQDGNIHV
ncbi:Target of rapamycin complex subunit LST8-1 [Lathyrus oleraceus]|uniref:Target of rapamycin complex subunit LST8 n=1 Tax=Pisum sativum TaxID=3888 RepID=A0A9D4YIT9_PEA|nr:Target of rapamycin complex subunit LST8-1 [Pisum sativum]